MLLQTVESFLSPLNKAVDAAGRKRLVTWLLKSSIAKEDRLTTSTLIGDKAPLAARDSCEVARTLN